VPSVFHEEVPITIPVAISTNHTQNTSWPSYSVQVQWHTDDHIADISKRSANDATAWHARVEVLRDQWSKPKQFKLHATRELSTRLALEQAVTQHIQDICTQFSSSHEAVVAMIRVQGPVHIPSDFTIIEMPTLDSMPQYRKNAVTTAFATDSATSAILYVTTQRPNAAAISKLVSSTTIAAPMPVAVAYCPDSATGIDSYNVDDIQAVHDAMQTAVDTLIRDSTVPIQYDHTKLSACISNTALVSRRAIAIDRTACNKMFEQIRYATTNDKLVQWSTLLNRFSVLACGIKANKALAVTADTTAATTLNRIEITADTLRAAISPFCEGLRDIYKHAVAESIQQKEMNRGDYALSVSLDYIIDWTDTACEVLLHKFSQQCALALSSVFATQGVSTESIDSMYDKVKLYLTAYAKTEVRYCNCRVYCAQHYTA
jgi:hypothetical protein